MTLKFSVINRARIIIWKRLLSKRRNKFDGLALDTGRQKHRLSGHCLLILDADLDGGEAQRIEGLPKEKLYNFAWSKDGKHFAFVRGQEIRDIVLFHNAE